MISYGIIINVSEIINLGAHKLLPGAPIQASMKSGIDILPPENSVLPKTNFDPMSDLNENLNMVKSDRVISSIPHPQDPDEVGKHQDNIVLNHKIFQELTNPGKNFDNSKSFLKLNFPSKNYMK